MFFHIDDDDDDDDDDDEQQQEDEDEHLQDAHPVTLPGRFTHHLTSEQMNRLKVETNI